MKNKRIIHMVETFLMKHLRKMWSQLFLLEQSENMNERL